MDRAPMFTVGIPPAQDVADHVVAHPVRGERGVPCKGAHWLQVDAGGAFGTRPQIVCLRVGLQGEIQIQNGYTFWQALDECKWAMRCLYTPVTEMGVPVRWGDVPPVESP